MTAYPRTLSTTCCIAGGGPAGMMLGFLLARAGVDVTVLEKHGDFLRDFRGDTINPSTLEVMHELGILEKFLKRPHQKTFQLRGYISGEEVLFADFGHLDPRWNFIAFMPQWDFLDFIADEARRFPHFRLMMRAEATALVTENSHIAGLRATTPDGEVNIRARLTVAADGRHSRLRDEAGLEKKNLGAPIDVLWMRISRQSGDPEQSLGRMDAGHVLALIARGDYWQCAFVVPKGGYNTTRARGLVAFRAALERLVPFFSRRTQELQSWDDIKLLTVKVDRLIRWHRPGFLCIGDAAHAMSPIGGVGINLAIQDALAAANILAARLRRGEVKENDLAGVQRRREWPTLATQNIQLAVQNRVIGRVLETRAPRLSLPFIVRLIRAFPILARIPAHIVGVGIQPEHVHTPETARPN